MPILQEPLRSPGGHRDSVINRSALGRTGYRRGGPIWTVEGGTLRWVDMLRGDVVSWNPDTGA